MTHKICATCKHVNKTAAYEDRWKCKLSVKTDLVTGKKTEQYCYVIRESTTYGGEWCNYLGDKWEPADDKATVHPMGADA